MQVERFLVGTLMMVNCYVVYDGDEAVIVDPGGASQEVLDFIDERNLTVKAIVNTHGHADHIAGNAWFMEKTGAPLLIHIDEEAYLSSEELNLARLVRAEFPVVKADRLLKDGDFIPVGDGKLEVLHTPGHSPGGISLYAPGFVISGDTLFQGSVGRWDRPTETGTCCRKAFCVWRDCPWILWSIRAMVTARQFVLKLRATHSCNGR